MDEISGAIAKYRRQADEMERFLSNCPAAAVAWSPAVTRWSILEIVAHLADSELLASTRIRRIITQDHPEMYGYKQELWAQSLAYRRQKIELVSARFAVLRRENASLLEMVGEEVWRLKGRHSEYGELSLLELTEDYISHTAKHLDQMRSAASAYEASNNKPHA